MRRAILASSLLAGLVLLILFSGSILRRNKAAVRVDVYDGFETPGLSPIWDTDRFEPGAVTMQSEVFRAGHGAAKVMVHSRDKFEAGINGNKDSERAELLEARSLVARENQTYEYSFSMLIPADFQIVPTRLVIAQWKQYCNGQTNCEDDSPVVALRYVSGVLRITQQTGRHQTALFETSESAG